MRISDWSSDVCSSDLVLDAPFGPSGPCMHEALFSDDGFAEGFTTLDVATALIDEGYHPMTMYFPLVVHGAIDRKSVVSGKSVSVRVDLRGRRILTKKKIKVIE